MKLLDLLTQYQNDLKQLQRYPHLPELYLFWSGGLAAVDSLIELVERSWPESELKEGPNKIPPEIIV